MERAVLRDDEGLHPVSPEPRLRGAHGPDRRSHRVEPALWGGLCHRSSAWRHAGWRWVGSRVQNCRCSALVSRMSRALETMVW